ncbi:MAG: NFACT RNA binding domain-containing protein [Proteobacteria bacterium]|nr:NFACT RNA binding domain-containing protein [Pseudomonadota bacterium]
MREARLRQIHADGTSKVYLELSKRSLRGVVLISFEPQARGLGWIASRPHAKRRPNDFQRVLRKELTAAVLERSTATGPRTLELAFRKRGSLLRLVVKLHGHLGNLLLLGPDGTQLGSLIPERVPPRDMADNESTTPARAVEPYTWASDLQALSTEGNRLMIALAQLAHARRGQRLLRGLARHEARLRARKRAIAADLVRAQEASVLRKHASLLLAHLPELRTGQTSVQVADLYTPALEMVCIEIDPKLGGKLQAQAWFRRAQRLERSQHIQLQRARDTDSELARLEQLRAAVEQSSCGDRLTLLEREASRLGLFTGERAPDAPQRKRTQLRLPYRTYTGSGRRPIRVGRSATDNDELLRRYARPQDLWLHVRGGHGAHVVIPLDRGEACPPQLLADAATLAVRFSELHKEARAEVLYTARRYVHKPRGARAGTVVSPRAKTLDIRIHEERLARLLRSRLDEPAA